MWTSSSLQLNYLRGKGLGAGDQAGAIAAQVIQVNIRIMQKEAESVVKQFQLMKFPSI